MQKFLQWLNDLFKGMMYEDDMLSLTRVLSVSGYAAFLIGSVYLMVNNIAWDGYSTFAGYTGGGGAALQFGNKLVNSKYNSAIGSYAPKEDVERYTSREELKQGKPLDRK